MQFLVLAMGFVLCSLALVSDNKTGKIKNSYTFSFMIIGILFALFTGQLKDSLLGILVPFVLLFIFWKIGGLGAGDIKLLMALGSLLGVELIINYMVIIFFVGFLHGIILFVVNKGKVKELVTSFRNILYTRYVVKTKDKTFKLGYSIFVGYIISVVVFNILKLPLFFTL